MTIAALFVDPHGVYSGLPGVEVWDETRDARLYAGPFRDVLIRMAETASLEAASPLSETRSLLAELELEDAQAAE